MGNYRFKLSDMMPQALIHKLQGKKAHPTRTGNPSTPKRPPPAPAPAMEQPYQPRRASYYFSSGEEKGPSSRLHHPRASDTLFPLDSPGKSKKKVRRKQGSRPSKNVVSSSAGWSCRATIGSVWETAEATPAFPASPPGSPPRLRKGHYHRHHYDGSGADGGLSCFDKLIIAEHHDDSDCLSSWTTRSSTCKVTSSTADVTVDVESSNSTGKFEETELALRPILTKPTTKEAKFANLKVHRDAGSRAKSPRNVASSPPLMDRKSSLARSPGPATRGVRLRATSPRLANRKAREQRNRKAATPAPASKGPCRLSESFAVVKASSDPQRDFRDSMMEMIVENNIKGTSDLEDLLACYLLLNSNEYHDVIVKAFEHIWFDLSLTTPGNPSAKPLKN